MRNNELFGSEIVSKGGHSTLRVFVEQSDIRQNVRDEIIKLGADCNSVAGSSLLAIDIPPVADFDRIDKFLSSISNDDTIAYSEVKNALDGTSPDDFSAQCAEVNAISRARNKEIDLKGATISVANVRGKKSSSGIHGTSKPPCSVCNPLLNKFDMNLLERCNKNG